MKVHKHGSTYNEQEEIAQMYPFSICPECLSSNTAVDTKLKEWYNHTGYVSYKRHGIMEYKYTHVNYICKDCGCEFSDEVEDKKEGRFINIDEDLVGVIISFIITLFSIFSIICSMAVLIEHNDTTAFEMLWCAVSWIVFIIASSLIIIFYCNL